jgi:PAS domain S-box-containing protein
MKVNGTSKTKTRNEIEELLNSYQDALQTEKHYHETLDNLLEGFQIISPEWRYLYVNNTVAKQGKYTREELVGHTMMEIYPGIEKTDMFKILQLSMNARVQKRHENKFIYPDNSVGWFELSFQPVPEGVIILSIDITERKTAELKNKEYTRGLEQMLFITSHKVRQPIAHILGLANILEHYSGPDEEFLKIIAYLKESSLTLDQYTRELNNYIQHLGKKH